jgi:RNA polymerase sigma factor (sigma-70 family)
MDANTLEAFRRGARDALERLYRLHVHSVESRVRYVLLRMGLLTVSNLADLVQEVFLRAFSEAARAQYDGQREYGPFLSVITHNVVIDWARRSAREPTIGAVEECFAEDSPAVDPLHEDDASAFERPLVAIADEYVRTLPDDLRAVHHHRHVLSLSQRQAADALGISRQSLRTLEKKLIAQFRRHLRRATTGGREIVLPAMMIDVVPDTVPERMGVVARRR